MILFLDFDGVLHPQVAKTRLFSCLTRLEKVLRDYPYVLIVISSMWRFGDDLEGLQEHFSADIQARIIGTTPKTGESFVDIILGQERYLEILSWISQNDYKGHWLALDDSVNECPQGCKELVACHSVIGFDQDAELNLRKAFQASATFY